MLSFSKPNDVRKFIASNEIQYITFYTSDIDGRLRTVTIPGDGFTDKIVHEGIGFDASNFGFATIDRSDMVMKPDLARAFEDPVYDDVKVLNFFCDTHELDSGESFGQDLRHIIRKALDVLKKEGIADEAKIGLELEFNVIDELHSTMTPRETSFRIESSELPNPAGGEEAYRIYKKHGYFRAEPNDHLFAIRNEIVIALKRVGLEVKYHHHEVGCSQAEIEFKFMPVDFMADATVLAKSLCHRIARKRGMIATFLPKLIPGEAGNGMHVHHFLLKDGVNVFDDEKGLYKLSALALSYIGGILSHADSLLAFTNPTTNSYRRLMPGFEAPVKAVFAEGNRSAAIRIPGYVKDPAERRFEFRTIDATCNPYLAYAAIIMAGLDGIRNAIDPTSAGFGPFEKNLYDLPKEQLDRIRSFPTTLESALGALKKDTSYLLSGGVFPENLIRKWIATKAKDIEDMRQVPHPWEVARYYDI